MISTEIAWVIIISATVFILLLSWIIRVFLSNPH
jgi:hypothetical protein